MPVPESHPFLSPPFLRSCLPSHSNKVGAASVLSFLPPRDPGLARPHACPPPALFFIFIFFGQPHPELASTRHFANVFANDFSTLFHHASCLPHVPSRRHVVSFVIAQSLEYLIYIAFLYLMVAPRLSSLCKIRTQDCILRIQEFEDEAFSNRIPLRLKDLELLHVVVQRFHVH